MTHLAGCVARRCPATRERRLSFPTFLCPAGLGGLSRLTLGCTCPCKAPLFAGPASPSPAYTSCRHLSGWFRLPATFPSLERAVPESDQESKEGRAGVPRCSGGGWERTPPEEGLAVDFDPSTEGQGEGQDA